MAELRISRIFNLAGAAITIMAADLSAQRKDPTALYVCICNALTDRQVKQAAATAGTTKPSNVYAACGCRAQCGQCVRTLINLLRGETDPMPEMLPAE
jgi:bacterioferritin-associated ferredoxin